MTRIRYFIVAAATTLLAAIGWVAWPSNDETGSAKTGANLTIPAFSAEALEGMALFEKNCAECHGPHASGSEQGPPLVHRLYEPNHHADITFQRAAKSGVRAHHWRFGDMPPIEGVSSAEVRNIIRYVRELQQANGIF